MVNAFKVRRFQWLLMVLGSILVLGWLWITPPGLLGKADALGYGVCHRIAEHSFSFSDRQLPLCARCTGMYLGALLGLVFFLRGRRRVGFPPARIMAIFAIFLAAFALDGANSFLELLNGQAPLYQPQNWLRLITGTMVGLAAAALLASALEQSIWDKFEETPVLGGYRPLAGLVGAALLVDLAVLSGNPLLLYPLGVLSGLTILIFLGLAYSIVWLGLLRKWNHFSSWRGFLPVLGIGLSTALFQILLTDLVRLAFTGTWGGLSF